MMNSDLNKRICELMELKSEVTTDYIKRMNEPLSLEEYLRTKEAYEVGIKHLDEVIDSLCKIYYELEYK